MRANGELSVDNYFEIRALALDDPEKLSVMDNLQLSFLFQELKKDANTKNYYVVFEGRRIPVVGKSEALNRKAIAAIGDKKSVPGHAKWWSAQYVHHPEPKFILT